MARLTDAQAAEWAKEHDVLPEEVGFHVQDGLMLRRLDDGRVQLSVVSYRRMRGHAIPIDKEHDPLPPGWNVSHKVVGSLIEVVFSTVLAPESWASCVASMCARGEDGTTWQQALAFHNAG
jgi:hypothetical protein